MSCDGRETRADAVVFISAELRVSCPGQHPLGYERIEGSRLVSAQGVQVCSRCIGAVRLMSLGKPYRSETSQSVESRRVTEPCRDAL